MTFNEFSEKLKFYKSEFKASTGREPNTFVEFEQYIENKKQKGVAETAKSLSWMLRVPKK